MSHDQELIGIQTVRLVAIIENLDMSLRPPRFLEYKQSY